MMTFRRYLVAFIYQMQNSGVKESRTLQEQCQLIYLTLFCGIFFYFSWHLNTKASIYLNWKTKICILLLRQDDAETSGHYSTRNAVETADESNNVFTLFRISRQTFTIAWHYIYSIETKRNSKKCFFLKESSL